MTDSEMQALQALGPQEVLRRLSKGSYGGAPGSANRDAVECWLRAELIARQEASDRSAAAIAAQALRQARRANTINAIQIAANAITAISAVFIGWLLSGR